MQASRIERRIARIPEAWKPHLKHNHKVNGPSIVFRTALPWRQTRAVGFPNPGRVFSLGCFVSAELLVNVTPRETRVAVIENGVVQELFVERASCRGLVGNIYKGKVARVLPGMQAAFVDIGLDRAAFLHASDVDYGPTQTEPTVRSSSTSPTSNPDRAAEELPEPPARAGDLGRRASEHRVPESQSPDGHTPEPLPDDENRSRTVPDVTELLREGQELLVQVIKDPIGTKGARLTTYISIPSCYLVFMPGGAGHGNGHVGISQRIEDEQERERLRTLVQRLAQSQTDHEHPSASGDHGQDQPWHEGVATDAAAGPELTTAAEQPQPPPCSRPHPRDGYIVRTAGESVGEELLAADMAFLGKLWQSIQARVNTATAPCRVHEELPLVIRTLRELSGAEIEVARIDSRETHRRVIEFAERFVPEVAPRIHLYTGERPIFDLYGVEDELHRALHRKVQLKSGGHLVIDQTEAMTTVDVNTGAYVGHRNLEETIFKTNLEATQAIARQLRLRNLGGIIIIDFIDMESDAHKRQVLRWLEKSLDRDPTKTQISDVSALGLVQMTRKRTRESLGHVLCEPCPTCSGRGALKSAATICYEIFREILREARQYDADKLLVIASPEVIDLLVDEESPTFAELETFIGKPITLQTEQMYSREQYDVVLM